MELNIFYLIYTNLSNLFFKGFFKREYFIIYSLNLVCRAGFFVLQLFNYVIARCFIQYHQIFYFEICGTPFFFIKLSILLRSYFLYKKLIYIIEKKTYFKSPFYLKILSKDCYRESN